MSAELAPFARVLRLDDVTVDDERSWAELMARAIEPHPFFDPAYLLGARRTMGEADDVRLVVIQQDQRWLALVPLSVRRRLDRWPIAYATTAGPFLGRRAALCVPLVDRDEPDAIGMLLQHLSAPVSGLPGLIELTLLPAESPVTALIHEHARRRRMPVQERSRFTRAVARADGPRAPDHLSASRRKSLRRTVAAAERMLAAPLEFLERTADPDALDDLLALECAGWKGRRGSAVDRKPAEAAWFRDYVQRFRAEDRVRILELRSGKATLWMSLVLVSGRWGFGSVDAYDEAFAEFRPGVVGRLREQAHLFSDGRLDGFDPCMHPKYTEASVYYPGTRDMVSLLVGARVPAALLLRLRSTVRRLRRTADPA